MQGLDSAVKALSVLKEHDTNASERPAKAQPINDTSFENRQLIGKGSYSTVYSAVHVASGTKVALKVIPLKIARSDAMKEQLKQEINVHRTLKHPHVVRLFSYYFTPEAVVLVMELCDGTLRERLRVRGCFSEPRSARYTRQIARALQYLHEKNVAHRDIKLENVLLDDKGVVKLADFGWSRHCGDGRATVCGTLDYLPPEMLLGERHTSKADVWSLGVVVAEMLSHHPPFYHLDERATLDAIRHAEPSLPEGLSESARSLLLRMLEKDPSKRYTVDEVLAHPWTQHDKLSSS